MPTLFKNGKNYSGTSVSLTQAEYDALSTTEKNNGTMYFITDSDAVIDASDVALGSGTVETLAGSIATIETSPATANHSVGEYIVYNGQLYRVTTAITAGQSLTVGTNISAVNVGNELSSLFVYKSYSCEYTLGANGATNLTGDDLGISTPAGYVPLAVRSITTRSNSVVFRMFDASTSGTGVITAIRNITATAVTQVFAIEIIYVKSGTLHSA